MLVVPKVGLFDAVIYWFGNMSSGSTDTPNDTKYATILVKDEVVPVKNEDGKYPCPKCNKVWLLPQHLKTHYKHHVGEWPYKCIFCGDTFRHNEIFEQHNQKCSVRYSIRKPTGTSNLSTPALRLGLFLLVTLLLSLLAFDIGSSWTTLGDWFSRCDPNTTNRFYLGGLRSKGSEDGRMSKVYFEHDQTELFYHLGGNNPWIPKKRDLGSSDIEPPAGYYVEQVHMMSRHAERYPTRNAGNRHLSLLHRLNSSHPNLSPAFSFLQNWTYFTSPSNPSFELLTSTSSHAGTLEAFSTGAKLRTRYPHLFPPSNTTTRFWSASSSRDVATARYFADGFFGREWEASGLATLEIIPESEDLGGNTLTPGDTCLNYRRDKIEGHDKGYRYLADWQGHYIGPIISRLQTRNGDENMGFTPLEVYSMQELCGFEMLVRNGLSPWCNLFSHEDWLNFEYARDLLHYYRAGPGNRYSKAMGTLWINATLSLLEQGPTAGTMFFSFVHDGDVIPMLSALGWPEGYDDEPAGKMPSDKLQLPRGYRTTDITPMGGRVIFERLNCASTSSSEGDNEVFIRLNINDAIVPINPRIVDGPGNSTSLTLFSRYIRERAALAGNFKQICGLDDTAEGEISFLHQ